MDTEKVIIIGGGPAGLAAAIYAARANLFPLVVAGAPPGGQLMLTTEVENYPGFDSILGPDLIEKMREHAKKFGTKFIDDNVKQVDFSKPPFTLSLSSGKQVRGETVLITTGASALWLGLENEQRLRGRGVSACATCDGFFFKDKTVVVVGGGDTAMEEALTLSRFVKKTYLIHRRDQFRASKIMQTRVMEDPKIEVIWNTTIEDVLGQERVEGVRIKNIKTNETQDLSVEGLFLAIGHKPDTDFLKDSGLVLDEKGYVETSMWVAWEKLKNPQLHQSTSHYALDFQSATSIVGVFAAGDCVDYVYRQAGTAVGMGIAAALDIERYLSEKG